MECDKGDCREDVLLYCQDCSPVQNFCMNHAKEHLAKTGHFLEKYRKEKIEEFKIMKIRKSKEQMIGQAGLIVRKVRESLREGLKEFYGPADEEEVREVVEKISEIFKNRKAAQGVGKNAGNQKVGPGEAENRTEVVGNRKTEVKEIGGGKKKRVSGYMMYLQGRRRDILRDTPGLGNSELFKRIAREWKGMSEVEKEPFEVLGRDRSR